MSRTTDANLDCAFVENALIFVVPKIGVCPGPPWRPPWGSRSHVYITTITKTCSLSECQQGEEKGEVSQKQLIDGKVVLMETLTWKVKGFFTRSNVAQHLKDN